jgi:hypothetical protein
VFIADTNDSRVVEVHADGSQTTIGTGLSSPHGVAVAAPTHPPALSPAAYDFGSQAAGTVGPAKVFTLTSSTLNETVKQAKITGTHGADYLIAQDNCSGHTLNAGQSCTIQVRLAPQATGPSNDATLEVSSADGTATAALRRRASPPVCSVPALKGKTLAQAKTLLSRAHCALGKVTQPRTHRRKFVISQSPVARSVRPAGTKVAVRLAPPGRGSLHVTLGAPRPSITVLRLHSGCLRPNFLGRFVRFRIVGHDRGHVKGFRFRVDHRPTRLRRHRSFRLTLDIPHLRRGRHILRIVATGHSGLHKLKKVILTRC